MFSKQDENYMNAALGLARRGVGLTGSNPSVGCVLVKNGRVIAAARTADGGRPHAEALALEKAGAQAKGATAYVTLEPCSHMGQTPPCVESLVKAGVERVVAACIDINPRVKGGGFKILKESGIKIETGLLEDEAKKINAGFFQRISNQRPFVSLKIAATEDGIVVPPVGQGRWITAEQARHHVQLERSLHDAVLIGINTALSDDPMLNARLPGVLHKTIRVILDHDLRLPPQSMLVQSAKEYPLWIFYSNDSRGKAQQLEESGARLFKINPREISDVLGALATEGINRLLVEGGAEVLQSFVQAQLYDHFLWYKAPVNPALKGGKSLPANVLNTIKRLKLAETRNLGQDLLEIYERPD